MAPRPPPALMDDLIIEILLRLTPDNIACLALASLVFKAWRHLLGDRDFHRRYREIHGAAPVLGILCDNYSIGPCRPLFIPTTPASPFARSASSGSPNRCRIIDCRHGRVLLHHHQDGTPQSLTVWDPVTGKQRLFYAPLHQHPHMEFTAAVLCASNGCDHLDCSSGPFLVVLLGKTYGEVAQANVYSSETGKWSASASIHVGSSFRWGTPSLLAGGTVFLMVGVEQIVMYDLARGILSVSRVQLPLVSNMILCDTEDGGPVVAALVRLLSLRTDPDGAVTEWARGKAIELDSMIPTSNGDLFPTFCIVGFAEGTGYIFISADDSLFSVEQKSGRINKIGNGYFGPIVCPFMRLYIPDLPSARLQLPMRTE